MFLVLKNKVNQRDERPVHWLPWYIHEGNCKNTQINAKLFHAHGSEELTLLKCPYYLKGNDTNELTYKTERDSQT